MYCVFTIHSNYKSIMYTTFTTNHLVLNVNLKYLHHFHLNSSIKMNGESRTTLQHAFTRW